jgi:hypothetical protein
LNGLRHFVQDRRLRLPESGSGIFFLRMEKRFRCLRQIQQRLARFPGGFVRFFFRERQIHLRNLVSRACGGRFTA